MVGAFKFYTSEWLTGGIHLIIIVIAAQADSAAVWPYALAAMAVVSFFAWVAAYRRYRQIHDLPTSKVASAAQGYVELFGHAEQLPNDPIRSKLTGLPCCWFRYYVERKSGDEWKYEDSGASDAQFLLVDETGQCMISPEGAEVISTRKQTWERDDHRYTEWLLLEKGPLYALGEFSTKSGVSTALDERADVSALLAEWKQDPAKLLGRFDLNRDGLIDLKEWELARLQARREVQKKNAEISESGSVHTLRKPGDGRLFLLSNELPDRLGRRFVLWSSLHLFVFFGAGAGSFLLFV